MDTVTHTLLGAAIGEVILGNKIGRKALFYGALMSNLPDIDVLGVFFLSDSKQLLFHRGITHSLFFIILISILLGWLTQFWIKDYRITWMSWTKLFLITMLSHLMLDSLTCYGMGLFEPFSHYRISFNIFFVADPFYTLPLLIGVIVPFIGKRDSKRTVKWNSIGLSISSCYLIFAIIIHNYVFQVTEGSFKEQKLISDDFTVTPTPLNTFLWMAYSHDKKGSWIGYYSIFDENKKIYFQRQERNDSLLIPFEKDQVVKNLKLLSKGNYFISKEDSIVYFNDIRFGQVSGWDKAKDEPYAFKFNLNKSADNKRALNRIKFKESTYEWFASLVNRIKGK
ncbi:metal-dependent hydrolase [Flavobacterium taihuense]|uniref:Metal-dependent hydrolase n=1 Tax=Flavobacterium taihuense TaxID=2857508 RepID=A0ABS6XW95_9FLAO|nr:metal-dependent hydrolase [Flavobacterium taihuense]MBW4360928.1 metal-dependent hydrolase [Flavobacterium taihuense]